MENTNTATTTFQVGETYATRSACDHNCVITVEVVKRTAKFITAIVDGRETKRLGVTVSAFDGAETVMPWGRGSMMPVANAARTLADI